MRNFILSAEAACDLSPELAEKYDVSVMPMKYSVDGEQYSSDDGKLSTHEMCEKMIAGAKTSTTQPNPAEVEEYLENLLAQGKDVLHLSFSSAQSGTCLNFKNVAEKLNATSKNKVYVVDTLCQSAGVGLLLSLLAEKTDAENLTAEQARDFAEETKLHILHYCAVDTFTFLARGGRIPAYLAAIGNLIKLKPIIHLDNAGKLVAVKKLIGRKRAIEELIKNFKETYDQKSDLVYISQSDCSEDAEYIKTEIEKFAPKARVTILPLGPIMVAHNGPGTIAVYYTADKR